MRALSACLVAVLAMSAAVVTACSSTSSDDSSTGGTGGSTAGTTSSGGTSAGTTSAGGSSAGSTATGAAGASDCSFLSDACGACLGSKCGSEETACTGDEKNGCEAAFLSLPGCACGGTMTVQQCETQFAKDGGSLAQPLIDCFNTNCATICAGK